MKEDPLYMLAQVVLPKELLEYFKVTDVRQTATEIHIRLDEIAKKEYLEDPRYESKGYTGEASVSDFPIRDRKAVLKIRRQRWKDRKTGATLLQELPVEIRAGGTRYSKDFGAFLKEALGYYPRDVPNP